MKATSATIEVSKDRSRWHVTVHNHMENDTYQSTDWGTYPSRTQALERAKGIQNALSKQIDVELVA